LIIFFKLYGICPFIQSLENLTIKLIKNTNANIK